jgi:hypothetical protein
VGLALAVMSFSSSLMSRAFLSRSLTLQEETRSVRAVPMAEALYSERAGLAFRGLPLSQSKAADSIARHKRSVRASALSSQACQANETATPSGLAQAQADLFINLDPPAAAPSPLARMAHMESGTAHREQSRLKVRRAFDASVGCGLAGRMVISGRMADVCAELERIAAH